MKQELIANILKSFIDDEDKMRDFFALSKEDFLFSYSYITPEEYEATRSVVQHTAEKFQEYVNYMWRTKLHGECE